MKQILSTNSAPAAIGPYSQATVNGRMIFTSGQLPIIPETGNLAEGIENQTKQSLENIRAILSSHGAGMDDIMKTTVYLKDMNDFGAMNGVYEKFFSEGNYPSRSAVQVAELPKGALVEIEAIAIY